MQANQPRRTGYRVMLRPAIAGMLVAALLCFVSPVRAQTQEESQPPPHDALETYLEKHGLRDLLITHLLKRVRETEGEERAGVAERLGGLYVQMLDEAATPAQRRQWERRAIDLLEAVPEVESIELRLTLAKARYLQAEEIAERFRLRLATPEERKEAETTLRTVAETLREIGNTLNRRVDVLDRREAAARDSDAREVREQLTEARRLRSLAMYYAGWSAYYSGLLRESGGAQPAGEAISHFGWLLNAAGRPANVERISPEMLRYEHVARAAIGCALAESLRGRDGAALLWLHAVESAPEVPESVKHQLFARRIVVLTAARRWADLQLLVNRSRVPSRGGSIQPLDTAEARLLAISMLEALDAGDVDRRAHDVLQSLADSAITDLITRGEARHVHDLVSRYGTALLSGEGFIVLYVRGLHAYEKARNAHALEENDQEPTRHDDVANLYSTAAQLFDKAARSDNADEFPREHAGAVMLGALCIYYSGSLEEAANRFERAYRLSTSTDVHPAGDELAEQFAAAYTDRAEDALWMAIVSLDKAVEAGRVSLKDRLERLATLYIQSYPEGDRTAMLLLRLSGEGIVSRERAAEILLAIPRDSPLYDPARRHAADLLYAMFRRARGEERDFAALRFAEISDELLAADLARINDTEEGRQTAQRAIIRLRQVLDAVLGMSAPDFDRANRAIEQVQAIARRSTVDTRAFEDELAFRRLQIALLRDRPEEAEDALKTLHRIGGRFGDAADRLLYQRALGRFQRDRSVRSAEEVVRHGLRVVDQFGTGAAAFADPVVQNLYHVVADAALLVWDQRGDTTHRDIALRLDAAIVEHSTSTSPPAATLKRFARTSEAAGDDRSALDAWRTLLSGLPQGTQDWFEARYNSLRLLATIEPDRAPEVFAQFEALYPSFGPQPWPDRFRELKRIIETAPVEQTATEPVPTGGDAQ